MDNLEVFYQKCCYLIGLMLLIIYSVTDNEQHM